MAAQPKDTSRPAFAVSVDGTQLPLNVALQITKICVDEDTLLPAMFTLDLPGGDEKDNEWIDGTLFPLGSSVEIKLGYGTALQSLITGEITGLEPVFSQGAVPTLTVRGHDRRHRLVRARKTRSFVQQKDSDIAATLASEVGLTGDVTDSSVVHDYVMQANQTDMEFLQERAHRIQYELTVNDKTLHFRPVQNDQGEILTITPGDDLLDFRPRLSTMQQPTLVEVRGWSVKDKKELVAQARAGDEVSTMGGQTSGAAAAESAFGDAPMLVRTATVLSQAEADQLARSEFNRAVLEFVIGDAVCNGRTDVRPGTVIKIDGIGTRFSGQYYVKSTSHHYRPNLAYRTHFVAWRNAS